MRLPYKVVRRCLSILVLVVVLLAALVLVLGIARANWHRAYTTLRTSDWQCTRYSATYHGSKPVTRCLQWTKR